MALPPTASSIPLAESSRPPLRPFQAAALDLLEAPQSLHLLIVSPTGSGKSRIFEEALASRRFQRALIVSPLVALHRQHAERLESLGIRVTVGLSGGTSARASKTRAWIVSPETLELEQARGILGSYQPDLLVVDECHCVWDWGAAFRPSFARLPELTGLQSVRKSLWLTATLPPEARRTLHSRIGEHGLVVEQGRFAVPPSLRLDVRRIPLEERPAALIDLLKASTDPAIVFSVTRQGTERLRNLCRETRIDAVTYHAGLSREERLNIENDLKRGKARVVIATSAFGMGMDFPTLKRAILWQAPLSLLDYAQATGRVARGRDGGQAVCFWHPDDFRLLQWSVGTNSRRARQLLEVRRYLEGAGCHRERLERAFLPPSMDATSAAARCMDGDTDLRPCSRCEARSALRK